MLNDKEHKDQLDDFSKLIKQRLENHRMPVDDIDWSEIESRLKPSKARRLTWWSAGIAASVAIVMLVFLFRPQDEIIEQAMTVQQSTIDSIQVNEYKTAITQTEQEEKSSKRVWLTTQKTEETDTIAKTADLTDPGYSLSKNDSVRSVNNSSVSNIADTGSDKKSDSVPALIQKEGTKDTSKKILLASKKKESEGWLLAAAFSAGSKSSLGGTGSSEYANLLQNTPNYASWGENPDAERPVISESLKQTSDYEEDADHALPLSFGFTVRKNITDRIGIESGLVYTYLSSKFSSSRSRAKQELHYLGIPVNVVFNVWSNDKWNIYISGGAMGEKGLRRKYTLDGYNNNEPVSNTIKEGISGIQWSLNASIGVSYKFYKDFGLYFEPKYSHFFDNDQPVSIRTEKNGVFGLSGGIRYEF